MSTTELTASAVAEIRAALNGSPNRCRFHGADFQRAGVLRGEPRCDSCKQPFRVQRALDALGAAQRLSAARREDEAAGL